MSLSTDLSGDLLSMLDTDEFAILATIGNASVKVIFDDAYTGVNLQSGEVGTSDPQIAARTADVSTVTQGTSVIINGVVYKVLNNEPDGTGLSILRLSKD